MLLCSFTLCAAKRRILLAPSLLLYSVEVSSIEYRASGKEHQALRYAITTYYYYLITRGGSLKKIAKNIIPKVPTNKKV